MSAADMIAVGLRANPPFARERLDTGRRQPLTISASRARLDQGSSWEGSDNGSKRSDR
jgi:hypothetical protein